MKILRILGYSIATLFVALIIGTLIALWVYRDIPAEDLEAKGLNVWIDREIGGGQQWRRTIEQNIHESSEMIVEQGIEQKIIKDVDINLLGAFMFAPISRLANPRLCYDFDVTNEDIETAFTMAWDAVKL